MEIIKQSFSRILNTRNFCIAVLLAFFLVLAGYRTAFSTDISANLKITDAKLYQGDRELSVESAATGSFKAVIEWRYESGTPIADGDTASFAFGTNDFARNGSNFHVRNSKDLPITDDNGAILGYWNITNRRINIRFSDAAVGHYILEGSITTAAETHASDSVAKDTVVYFPIADRRIAFTRKASTLVPLSDSQTFSNLATNGTLYWDYYTPGITANEFYKGNGQVDFTDKAKLSDLSYETTLSPLATGASVNIYALAQLPLDLNDVTAGAAGAAFWINLTAKFNLKNQAEGQSYEDFFAEMKDGEYGVYQEENGRFKVAVKFGSQPSNITYAEAMAASGRKNMRVGDGYISMPEARDALNMLDTPGTVSDGKVLRFVAEIAEQIPAGSGGTRVSVDSDYAYSTEEGKDYAADKTTTTTVPVGSATASIIGEARLRLVDESTGMPLPGREFILQEQDGDEWKDLENTRRSTDSDGRIQILNLTPGKNYRWQQISFAEHYDEDSLKVQVEQAAPARNVKSITKSAASIDTATFTMPTNAGINFLATNAMATYRVTYKLGVGSDDDDITYEQSYGEETRQPDMDSININDGYTFEGWDRDIADTVTEDAVYVARWSSAFSTRGTGTTPESIPDNGQDSNVEPPFTYDGFTRYIAILTASAMLSLYFAPSALRAYRVHRYRKQD